MRGHDDEEKVEMAAQWLARQDAGLSPAEEAEFERWLEVDPRHAAAVAELSSAWATMNRPREIGRADHVLGELAARAGRRRMRHATIGLSMVGLAAAVVVLSFQPFRARAPNDATATQVAIRPDRQKLPDGSVVQLNAGAHIQVDYSATRRLVRLVRGEAYFGVAKDQARPFVVSAGGVEVHAVGTEFAVRFAPDLVDVVVTEGRVAVARTVVSAPLVTPRASAVEPVLVEAGRRAIVPEVNSASAQVRLEALEPAEIDATLAWRSRRVEFTGVPLSRAVALFDRHNRLRFTIEDSALAELRVSGIYWIDDPEGFARLLQSSFDLRVERRDEKTLALLRAR